MLWVIWDGEHTIRYNANVDHVPILHSPYAPGDRIALAWGNHDFLIHTRLYTQQAGTGHEIVGQSKAGWWFNTGVYTGDVT